MARRDCLACMRADARKYERMVERLIPEFVNSKAMDYADACSLWPWLTRDEAHAKMWAGLSPHDLRKWLLYRVDDGQFPHSMLATVGTLERDSKRLKAVLASVGTWADGYAKCQIMSMRQFTDHKDSDKQGVIECAIGALVELSAQVGEYVKAFGTCSDEDFDELWRSLITNDLFRRAWPGDHLMDVDYKSFFVLWAKLGATDLDWFVEKMMNMPMNVMNVFFEPADDVFPMSEVRERLYKKLEVLSKAAVEEEGS